ncbi:WD repeat-containing protein 89 [Abortiporus biennis]
MSLLPSPSLTTTTTSIKSTSLQSDAYVLSLASLPSHYAAASSSPLNSIHLFDKSNFQKVAEFHAHDSTITHMRSVQNMAGRGRETLISCGKDGVVKAWDERSGTAALQMNALTSGARRSLLSCDVSSDGLTVAGGTELQGDDASILYWDPRNPAAPLRAHTSTHSDDITAIHFLKLGSTTQGNIVLSASSDGLLCTSNADEPDEDEAGLHVGNWGCSIAQAGWVQSHTGSPSVWASSDMETFSLWSKELDLVRDVDIRQPSVHKQDLTWVTDYIIGCHNLSSIPDDMDSDLCLFAGSNEGDIALLTKVSFSAANSNSPWTLRRLWTSQHVGVVRALLWDEKNNVLVTGGEDSRINAWSSGETLASNQNAIHSKRENSDAMDVDEDGNSPQRKKRRS